MVVGAALVEVEALHAVDGLHVVPDEYVPEAPGVGSSEGVAGDVVGEHVAVGCERVGTGVVASEVVGGGCAVLQLAEESPVVLVPSVVPLCAPVVLYAVDELVVPDGLELEVDDGELEGAVACGVEMELGAALAGGEGQDGQGGGDEVLTHGRSSFLWGRG